jgi:plasmid stabilization system protein ParE
VAAKHTVKLTANFERNLKELESFLLLADAPQAFDALLDDLLETVVPNLERFPGMGRLFFERPVHSVEVSNGMDALKRKLNAMGSDGQVREYVMAQHLVLYTCLGESIYLLSIRHQRQLSFDFQTL